LIGASPADAFSRDGPTWPLFAEFWIACPARALRRAGHCHWGADGKTNRL
jgi:hypothetical protein